MTVYSAARTVAVVPCHNEAASIGATLAALKAQTYPLDRIVVVPNNCTDGTADVARSVSGVEVWEMPGHNPDKKAGALNWAISHLLVGLDDRDRMLVTDGDSILTPSFVAEAVISLDRRRVGAVCANFHGDQRPGVLPQLQRNEYSRFARQIRRRHGRARVLSGVATMFRVEVIRDVLAGRLGGRLPVADGLYHTHTATEDIELTFAVRRLGWRMLAPRRCLAVTDTMPTAEKLWHQRVRWQRGMLDSLRLYGVRRDTAGELARQVGIYLGSLTVPAYLTFLTVAAWLVHGVPFQASWLPLTVVFLAERVLTVRRDGVRAMVLAALMAPEWVYEQFRSAAYWSALWHTARGSDRVWQPT